MEAHQAWLTGLRQTALATSEGQPSAQVEKKRKAWLTLTAKLSKAAESSGYILDQYLARIAPRPRRTTRHTKTQATDSGAAKKEARNSSAKSKTVASRGARGQSAATGQAPAPSDDLTRIKGIGPKISAALQAAGLTTFAQLARANEASLKAALAAASLRSAPNLRSWTRQAAYLAKGDEKGFAAYIQKLSVGQGRKEGEL
jgi:predicted flap endonuclease-1-like 5' DNA nuclease